MKYLPPAPRKRHVPGLSPAKPTSSALARSRDMSEQHARAERPFEPGRRGSWKGSSRDLVVNARKKLQPGYAYEYEDLNERHQWETSDDEEWDTRMLSESDVRGAKYVGTRSVDGSRMNIFKKPRTYGYYAQLPHMSRNAAAGDDVPEHLRAIDFRYNDPPEENGESIRYGSFDMGKQTPSSSEPQISDTQWYEVEYATGSDYSGGSVTQANNTELKKLLEEAHPGGESPAVWAEAHGGHGTYAILVVWDLLDESIQEVLNGLEDYPAIDDESVSEVEHERESEAWEGWAQRDFEKAFLKSLNAEMQIEHPEYEVDDWPDDLDSFRLFSIAQQTSNTEWVHESGDSVYIDIERVVDGKPSRNTNHWKVVGAIQIVLDDQRPDWLSADDNEFLDEVDEAFGLETE